MRQSASYSSQSSVQTAGHCCALRAEVLPIPTVEFILKVTPENSGSKHLVLGTEDIPPGGVIPKHKHLEQDEILLVQTGTAHVTLDDKEYDVTWLPTGRSARNTSHARISRFGRTQGCAILLGSQLGGVCL
jgi:hypothetical protein